MSQGNKSSDNLVWIDLEMTGLDAEQHVILEIATIITNKDLEILAEGPNIAINYPRDIMDKMEEWSRVHHHQSGLMERVTASSYDCPTAEKETLSFISSYCIEGESPLCGNSIWQDRRFLIKYMPDLENYLNYRNIDVSSIKELAKRWYPSLQIYEKQKTHLASMDIRESIKELKYYRREIFIS